MKTQETNAEKLFKQFCEGYKNRDLKYVLSLFSKNINMWGSGLDEYCGSAPDLIYEKKTLKCHPLLKN